MATFSSFSSVDTGCYAELTETSSSSALPGDSDTDSTVSVLMDKLRAPRLSELTRKWKVHCNTPQGRRRSCGRGAADTKSVTPAQRAKEFCDEDIVVSNGKLFCRACRQDLSTERSVFSHPQQLLREYSLCCRYLLVIARVWHCKITLKQL